jgi:hypothetical protein
MKGIKATVVQELQMKNDPILGTSYGLVNVIFIDENNLTEKKDCNHNEKQLIHIGNRNYCTVCSDWIITSNTQS